MVVVVVVVVVEVVVVAVAKVAGVTRVMVAAIHQRTNKQSGPMSKNHAI